MRYYDEFDAEFAVIITHYDVNGNATGDVVGEEFTLVDLLRTLNNKGESVKIERI